MSRGLKDNLYRMMNCPLVSVVIPTKDRYDLVKGSIENVRQQSYSNLEIVIVEDGSKSGISDYISDFFKMRFFENISGDKKEIVKTEILKKNIFPNFENEKRVVTSTLWNRIAYDYDCLCLNYPVSVKRYIKGGMSDTLLALKAESPNYQIEDCITTINFPNQFSLRITLIYSTTLWKYWFFGGNLSLSRIKLSRLPFVFFGLPLGLILYLKDELKLRSLKSYDR